jgi:hypothetical protein
MDDHESSGARNERIARCDGVWGGGGRPHAIRALCPRHAVQRRGSAIADGPSQITNHFGLSKSAVRRRGIPSPCEGASSPWRDGRLPGLSLRLFSLSRGYRLAFKRVVLRTSRRAAARVALQARAIAYQREVQTLAAHLALVALRLGFGAAGGTPVRLRAPVASSCLRGQRANLQSKYPRQFLPNAARRG